MSIYPTVRPSLTLDFQKSKQLDPRISFSRSSSATYVEGGVVKTADEHQARFEKEGLLLEQSRTNFLTYSVDFSQQFTAVRCSFTANTTVAPDGTITATTLIEDTASNSHLLSGYTGIPQNGNGTHTFSVFAKAKERSAIALSTNRSTGQHAVATFDLSSGVVSQYGGTNDGTVDYVRSSMSSVGNGWYRCTLTYSNVGDVWPNIEILNTTTYTYSGYGRHSYLGDGTSGVYIWGVQMEQNSSFPTSYIPTSGSSITRSADIAQITGNNFSSWYNPNKGALVLDMKRPPVETFNVFLCTSGGGYFLSDIAGTMRLRNFTGGAYDFGTITTDCKIASSYLNGTGFNTSFNGSVAGAVSDTNTFAGTQLEIGGGSNAFTSFWRSGNSTLTVARLSYYSEQLTDAQLEAITS